MPTYQEYVVGFMINADHDVLLIRKNRPAFQKGLWNGIGGKVEPGETILHAMVREFREEAGVQTVEKEWTHTVSLCGPDFAVHYFRNCVSTFPVYHSMTDETVGAWDADAVSDRTHNHEGCADGYRCPTLDNLRWILPLQFTWNIRFPIAVSTKQSDEAKL